MTYAIEEDIQNELKRIVIGGDTGVTRNAIVDFLTQEGAKIDAFIGKRYTTPIVLADDPKSFALLKKIEIDFVVYRVTKILNLSRSVPIPEKGVTQDITEGSAYRESMKMLQQIKDGKLDLPDSDLINSSAGFGSFHSESINSDVVPCFDRTAQQW